MMQDIFYGLVTLGLLGFAGIGLGCLWEDWAWNDWWQRSINVGAIALFICGGAIILVEGILR